jgi:hypothetical protein
MISHQGVYMSYLAGFFAAMTMVAGAQPVAQSTFATPKELVQAAVDAAARNDTAALLLLFGPRGQDIVESGNQEEDKERRAEFARSAAERTEIDVDAHTPDRVTFSVGKQDWPFPAPVVRTNGRWHMDTASARLEILARRIGRNELNAVEACRGYVEAQREYATGVRGGDMVLKYAQRIVASSGIQDGLYSEGTTNRLVSRAFADAVYGDAGPVALKPVPWHGYFFRILKSQGADAPGGAFSYIVNGKMIGGFALVAWPAEYGVTGVRTLMVSHEGNVYGRDLGATTSVRARQITDYNPGKYWRQTPEYPEDKKNVNNSSN